MVLKLIDELKVQCCVVDTDRGKHFLFKNTDVTKSATKTNTALGVTVDVKVGLNNSYQVLKLDGVARKWIRHVEDPDPLPIWLQPVKHDTDFVNMEEGDGRNQTLFTYILTLQRAGFTKTDIKETIGIINQYVMKTPLEQRELDVILRDEAFMKKSFFNRGNFLHHDFAQFLKANDYIVKVNNVLHIYKDGIYSDRSYDIEAAMIRHLPQLTQGRRRETSAYLEIIANQVPPAPVNLIALSNGIYDLETGEVTGWEPELVIKNRLPVHYQSDAYDKTVDVTLNKMCCNDRELRMLLEEIIGYMLLRRNELGKCFILTGSGSNGKSTFIDMVKAFLGPDNYSSLSMEEIGQRFKTAEIYGKLANLGDDISNQYIDNNAVFKKLVTGETVNVERKGKDPFDFNNYAKIIFSANQLPRINDTTDGLMRRLIIIPFNAKFSSKDDDYDPFIKDKLISDSAMKYLLRIGLEGLKRVLARKQFTIPDIVAAELKLYEEYNNPVLAFINDGAKVENEATNDVYLRYSTWSHENGLKPMGSVHFSRAVCRQLHMHTNDRLRVDNKQVRVFKKI